MPQGLSIHLGLNHIDPTAYGGFEGRLAGCLNDAAAMQKIASAMGYSTESLLDEQATSANLIAAISSAAGRLTTGDILLLTYSGHGAEVPDPTHTEPTGMNQTWVLFDRLFVDDELYALWSRFAAGVRIFVLSDSCHSGTVTRDMQYANALAGNAALSRGYGVPEDTQPQFRNMPVDRQQETYQAHKLVYDVIGTYTPKDLPVQANILLISGCQDNQLSADGAVNGLFTQNLLQVWNGGFQGDYRRFQQAIVALMPPTQVPNYYVVGAPSPEFERQQPFSITPGTGGSGGPGIAGSGASGTAGSGSQAQNEAAQWLATIKTRMSSDPWFEIRLRLNPRGTLAAAGVPAAVVDDVLSRLWS